MVDSLLLDCKNDVYCVVLKSPIFYHFSWAAWEQPEYESTEQRGLQRHKFKYDGHLGKWYINNGHWNNKLQECCLCLKY